MEKNENKFFTIILIPHSPEDKTFVLKIPKKAAKMFAAGLITVLLFVLSLFIYSSYYVRRAASYEDIKQKLVLQDKQIKKFDDQTKLLDSRLEKLIYRENQIRKMLGLSTDTKELTLNNKVESAKDIPLEEKIKTINSKINEKEKSIKFLLSYAKAFRERFSHIPSIWPIYGQITSNFGYRIFPWRGFHSGIDITASYGSPIKSAGDGVVEYAGWKTGYGKAVIINHGFGYETLYGHTSSFCVSVGQRVKKGQVIAYVGTTGYATGPHLHYEVIKNGRQINPTQYLDLSVAMGLNGRI